MSTRTITRRRALGMLGGTLGGAVLAGCTGRTATARTGVQQGETVRAFVGAYHWGFFVLDRRGNELERVRLAPGDELRLTLFSVEATAAVDRLPRAVRNGVPDADERERRNVESVPVPAGADLEALHEAAEAAYPDHGLAIVRDAFLTGGLPGAGIGPGGAGPGPGAGGRGPGGMGPGMGPWSGGMGPGMGPGGIHWGALSDALLAPPVYLWHRSTVPAELGFVVERPGSFGFACHVYCGYGHPYMVERGRVVVDGG